MQSTAADPLVGHVLEGRYRVRARLAAGGMSVVYSGIDERLDREVAIKVMTHTLSADPVFVDRFAREARAAAKLSHVNTVSVYDQGSDGGNTFLVMELVRGRTLRDLIRERGRVSPAEAVSLMEPVLAALAAAHRAGLVHRDVKPENILLSDDGVVKVADFGLARAVESNAAATHTGLMMGTVAYSSPEQFRGGSVDIRSDVYSAGIVLFELLIGHPPYHGPDAMAVAYQHVHNDVPAPSSLQRGIGQPLDRLIRRATARDPALRPPDAGTFLGELDDVRRELHLPVMPVPRRQRGPAPARPVPTGRTAATSRTTPDARPPLGPQPTLVHAGRTLPPAPPPYSAPLPPPPAGASESPVVPKRRPRRMLRTIIGAIVLLIVCAALIAGSWWWAAGRYSAVPDVRGQTVPIATAALRDKGFDVITDAPAASDTVAAGAVISTDPSEGDRLVRGRAVHLVVSSGPIYYAVPNLVNRTRAVAAQALTRFQANGVTVTYSQAAHDTIRSGSVISTTPNAGTKVKRGDSISVVVSTGLPIVSVPDVGGRSQADATTTLTGQAFKVSVTQAFSDEVDAGDVISQTPGAASKQRKFATIALVVSKGPDLVEVPELPGRDPVDDARQRLEALGFQVDVETVFGGISGLVVGMDPDAGTKLRRGATVTLTVV